VADSMLFEAPEPSGPLPSLEWSPAGPGWAIVQAVSLGALYSIARVTIDYNSQYWVATWDTNQPTIVWLWSWSPAGTLTAWPPQTSLGQTAFGPEELSWITTERPDSGYTQGLIHVSTRLASTSTEGFLLFVFNPLTSSWIWQAGGGNQSWPDPTVGGTVNGVVSTFVALALLMPPPPTLNYDFRAGSCGSTTPVTTGASLTGAAQVDYYPPVPPRVVVTGYGIHWRYYCYSFPTCAAQAGLLMQSQANGILSVLGYGWHYSQYITTGTIAPPY